MNGLLRIRQRYRGLAQSDKSWRIISCYNRILPATLVPNNWPTKPESVSQA